MICVADNNQLMPDYNTFGYVYISPEKFKSVIKEKSEKTYAEEMRKSILLKMPILSEQNPLQKQLLVDNHSILLLFSYTKKISQYPQKLRKTIKPSGVFCGYAANLQVLKLFLHKIFKQPFLKKSFLSNQFKKSAHCFILIVSL